MLSGRLLFQLSRFFPPDAVISDGATQSIRRLGKFYLNITLSIVLIPDTMLDRIFHKRLDHHVRYTQLSVVYYPIGDDLIGKPVFEPDPFEFKITGKKFYFVFKHDKWFGRII